MVQCVRSLSLRNHKHFMLSIMDVKIFRYRCQFWQDNLCFNGSHCYTSSYYTYKSVWPYYIVIHKICVYYKCHHLTICLIVSVKFRELHFFLFYKFEKYFLVLCHYILPKTCQVCICCDLSTTTIFVKYWEIIHYRIS